jgi:hypothetical protein
VPVSLPVTPGAGEPRESVKVKKVMTSTSMVFAAAVVTATADEVMAGMEDAAVVTAIAEERAAVVLAAEATELTALAPALEVAKVVAATEALLADAAEVALDDATTEAALDDATTEAALDDATTEAALDDATTEAEETVELPVRVMVQDVAAPLPSTLHTTGCTGIAEGGQVS